MKNECKINDICALSLEVSAFNNPIRRSWYVFRYIRSATQCIDLRQLKDTNKCEVRKAKQHDSEQEYRDFKKY